MSHADEVRALLLEVGRVLRYTEIFEMTRAEQDRLAGRCLQFAEDLARPPSVPKWELGGEPLLKPPLMPSKLCDICHMSAKHFQQTAPDQWTSLCTDCFALSPVPSLRVTGIDATHDAAGEEHLENMNKVCAGPATSVRSIAEAVRYLLEKERSRD